MIDLDRLRQLEKSATPGPWTVDETKALGAYGIWTDYATHPGWDKAGYPDQICAFPMMQTERPQRDANAYLLAELRNNASALLEALVQGKKIVAMLRFAEGAAGIKTSQVCGKDAPLRLLADEIEKLAALLGKEPPHA